MKRTQSILFIAAANNYEGIVADILHTILKPWD